jgi:2-polyprenyl-3-methyl-5-hydroxy-6-metoxy-1,4-benzoquinol methylase
MLNELKKIYIGDLFDIHEVNENFTGIYSSVKDQAIVSKYLHGQFTANAEAYNKQYNNYYHSQILLSNAFKKISTGPIYHKNNRILDIGSGSGLSVIPLLTMFENSQIICSDLSLDLLKLLQRNVLENNCKNHPVIMQLNAEELDFQSETFDFVVGLAILHHLFNPEKTLKCCLNILKSGGYAIFYEPFENGNAILCCIYETILKDPRSDRLDRDTKNLLTGMIKEMRTRRGRDKTADIFLLLDDKWLFTKKYFEEYCELYRFSELKIYSLREGKNQFSAHVKDILKIAINIGPDGLPDWAWNIVEQFDNMFSDDLMNDLLIEGCIILKK